MGAEALRDCLTTMDMNATVVELQEQMRATRSKQIKKKLSKRLKVIQGFIGSNSRPEWMVLAVLPVIPPDAVTDGDHVLNFGSGKYHRNRRSQPA